ncbi:MAG: sn-glycerol-1-phosphate dehydrogenase [Clostridia bacterium]|nr:sn-glycerol-1-phosphate dehydrogenase [Clostridia bacterium]MBN2883094.1 sn-glycerol-1-phosphate dehydrogenase [Clostridia bacterium]
MLSDLKINELVNKDYICSCGKTHRADIERIDLSENAIVNAVEYIVSKRPRVITVICDENTYVIAGKSFGAMLETAGIETEIHIIKGRNGLNVAPDDAHIGEVFARISGRADMYVAVGSGVVNDITRIVSHRAGKNYIVFGTAPSMDGYASVTSSLVLNNIKESIPGQCPIGIFGQPDILKNAPFEMLTAGFGDVIGKYNAIREWKFGRDLIGEHYCPEIVDLVEKAVDKCVDSAQGLKNRNEEAVISVMEALILAGMAMGLYGNTRPASGAEHHIVHYWDVDCIKRGVEHELHGNSVGIGTVVICKLFNIVKDKLPVETEAIDPDEITRILKTAGCKTSPLEAGIERDLLKRSIINGHTMSSKFTVLKYLSEENPDLLEFAAEALCKEYYN